MAASKTELLPWEARLAAALPDGKEDLVYLRTSFGPMKQAGWKDRESAKNPRSDCKLAVRVCRTFICFYCYEKKCRYAVGSGKKTATRAIHEVHIGIVKDARSSSPWGLGVRLDVLILFPSAVTTGS